MSKQTIVLTLATIAASSMLGSGVVVASHSLGGRPADTSVAVVASAAFGSGPGPHHCGTNTNPCPK
jgi:hypothetical protein